MHAPYVQADVMREQFETSAQSDYGTDGNTQSLGLLLHQFYLDRMSHCTMAKHAHLLRWRRFAEHSRSIEDAYPAMKTRLGYIMSEHADCKARAARLSQARDVLLAGPSTTQATGQEKSRDTKNAAAASVVSPDDIEIYIRWLVTHFYAQKGFLQAMKLIQWCPYMMSIEARARGRSEDDSGQDDDDDDALVQKQTSAFILADAESVAGVSLVIRTFSIQFMN